MASIDTSNPDRAIKAFQDLPGEEQLAALGTLFKGVSGSIPTSPFSVASIEEVTPLVEQIGGLGQDEQLKALTDLLASKSKKGGKVALDPNPSKALAELVTGKPDIDLSRYESLNTESRLAFWYQLGQHLSASIPANSSLSPEADELLASLKSAGAEQQAAFLSQIV